MAGAAKFSACRIHCEGVKRATCSASTEEVASVGAVVASVVVMCRPLPDLSVSCVSGVPTVGCAVVLKLPATSEASTHIRGASTPYALTLSAVVGPNSEVLPAASVAVAVIRHPDPRSTPSGITSDWLVNAPLEPESVPIVPSHVRPAAFAEVLAAR